MCLLIWRIHVCCCSWGRWSQLWFVSRPWCELTLVCCCMCCEKLNVIRTQTSDSCSRNWNGKRQNWNGSWKTVNGNWTRKQQWDTLDSLHITHTHTTHTHTLMVKHITSVLSTQAVCKAGEDRKVMMTELGQVAYACHWVYHLMIHPTWCFMTHLITTFTVVKANLKRHVCQCCMVAT